VGNPFVSHRALSVLAGLAAVVGSAAGCGDSGSNNSNKGTASGDAAGAASDSSAAECQKTSLQISASGTVTTPDRSPFNPTLAANPSGDTFLGAWIDVPVPGAIWASVLGSPTGGVASSRATQVTTSSSCNPVAAWTGSGFAVAWGNGTNLMVQQLDSGGATVGCVRQPIVNTDSRAS
jgi:hypothetical protein